MSDVPADLVPGDYRRVVGAASVGTFIEIYDLLVYGYFASILAEQFFPRQDPTAALLATFAIYAVGFAVRPIGAIIFGHIGDRVGRRAALTSSLLLMSGSTLAFGLLPNYNAVGVLAPALLLICRLLQGLSASGELTGANVLVLEYAPSGRQGRAVAVVNAVGNLGAATAAAIGFTLARVLPPEQLADWGWRVAFLAAAPIGFVGLYLRIRALDSPAFIALGGRFRGDRPPLMQALRSGKRGLLVLGAWTAGASLGGYLLVGFLPSYLIRNGRISAADAFAANGVSILVLVLSTLSGGYLIDRYSLRQVAVGVGLGVMVTTLPAFLIIMRSETLAGAMLGQSILAMFLGAAGVLGAFLGLVLFPVPIRFTGTALASNVAVTLFGSTAPYVSTWLTAATGGSISLAFYLLATMSVALIAVTLGLRPVRAHPAQT
ncbi:MAG TPA: MFS transporter [Kineosporiaceae bacterium]|nr:MFS transporter [Kineosporiaceae bacterium]